MDFNLRKALIAMFAILISTVTFSQSIYNNNTAVEGKVIDGNSFPISGAEVQYVGNKDIKTLTDDDGTFRLEVPAGKGMIEVYSPLNGTKQVSFEVEESKTLVLYPITLNGDEVSLDELVVVGSGIIDLVKDRQTPIASTTIKAEVIQEKLGNLEFPEALRGVPSVYPINTGGYGDGSYTVRGFDQSNVLVMINGQPVNDMEWGGVYWSNWSGLTDVASVVQQQRGLGSSKIGIPSVGGTTNIVTKAADRKQGGFVKVGTGNDGYFKSTATYNTGLGENGWAASALLSYWRGDGYMDATEGEGGTYFFALGYKPNSIHQFNFTVTGAPQFHQQDYRERISTYEKYGYRYNSNWGYKNGEEFSFSRNFYHKPIANLNWDWKINDELDISTVVYGSWGLGGGTGTFGTAHYKLPDDENGLIRVDDLVRANSGQVVDGFGTVPEWDGAANGDNRYNYFNGKRVVTSRGPGTVLRSSVNQHSWYGALSSLDYKITPELTLNAGVDLRTYLGKHYRVVNDLLGADAYYENINVNAPGVFVNEGIGFNPLHAYTITNAQKVNRSYDARVRWAGIFGQLEYANDLLSAFVQGSLANQYYKRYEYFEVPNSQSETGTTSEMGGNIKAGINYKFNRENNVFFNAGYFSRQPFFSSLYQNSYTARANEISNDYQNEKVFSLEAGYGYRTRPVDIILNIYRTVWDNRQIDLSYTDASNNRFFARSYDLAEIHQGIELELTARPMSKLDIFGMASIGDWTYKDDITASFFDNNNKPIPNSETTLYVDGAKTGGSPQLQTRLGFDYEIIDGLGFDMDWYYNGDNYATANASSFSSKDAKNLKMPSYHLFDAGVGYKFNFGSDNRQKMSFRLNVNNLFDNLYIARGYSNIEADPDAANNWNGINKNNTVEFGFGRTWNVSVKYDF